MQITGILHQLVRYLAKAYLRIKTVIYKTQSNGIKPEEWRELKELNFTAVRKCEKTHRHMNDIVRTDYGVC